MRITRHYLTVQGRRVHYRMCGKGPPVLLIHQSPRSSAEYSALMQDWGHHFTCYAPDSPGFGQSTPLTMANPGTDDFGDAIIAFADALGMKRIAAYGFHSGGIFLMNAMRRYPARFAALAVGGYPRFRPEEAGDINEDYLLPFRPQPFGEHLVWAWNRFLEQSWYFPWFKPEEARRLPNPHADLDQLHAMVMDLLDAGDAYRFGYRAAFACAYDIPSADAAVPPALVSTYAGDPMSAHAARFDPLPAGWDLREQPSPAAHYAESRDFLARFPAPDFTPAEAGDGGFVSVSAGGFDGLIHWQGAGNGLRVHGPGRAGDLLGGTGIRIDLPGHGLSDPWPGDAPTDRASWQAVIDAAAAHFAATRVEHEALPAGDPDLLYPDLSPDRFGHYLVTAWTKARAGHVFAPWYETSRSAMTRIDSEAMQPQRLAREHRALLRGHAARALHLARMGTKV